MIITSTNKFTYPLLFQRGKLSTLTENWIRPSIQKIFSREYDWFSQEKKVLGRWNLKHNEKDLNQFYQYLPDPGYPNTYQHTLTTTVISDSSIQYTHSGKMQN